MWRYDAHLKKKENALLEGYMVLPGSDKPSVSVWNFRVVADLDKVCGLVDARSRVTSLTSLKSPPMIVWYLVRLAISAKNFEKKCVVPPSRGIHWGQDHGGILQDA